MRCEPGFFSGSIPSMSSAQVIVLDEADRLLEECFREPVQAIVRDALRPNVQVLAFSATFPPPLVNEVSQLVPDRQELSLV